MNERFGKRLAYYALTTFVTFTISDILVLLVSTLPNAFRLPTAEVTGLRETFFFLAVVRPVTQLGLLLALAFYYYRSRAMAVYVTLPRRRWYWNELLLQLLIGLIINAAVSITWAAQSGSVWRTDLFARQRLLGVHFVILTNALMALDRATYVLLEWRVCTWPACARRDGEFLYKQLSDLSEV